MSWESCDTDERMGPTLSHADDGGPLESAVLSHSVRDRPIVTGAQGHMLQLENGSHILDASGGAAVSCFGHSNQDELTQAMGRQTGKVYSVSDRSYSSIAAEEFTAALVATTNGAMVAAYICNSGEGTWTHCN